MPSTTLPKQAELARCRKFVVHSARRVRFARSVHQDWVTAHNAATRSVELLGLKMVIDAYDKFGELVFSAIYRRV